MQGGSMQGSMHGGTMQGASMTGGAMQQGGGMHGGAMQSGAMASHGMQPQNHGMTPQDTAYRQNLYSQILPVVRHVLEVMLMNEFEDSIHAVANFVLQFSWPDGSTVSASVHDSDILKGRVLEALCHWMRQKAKELDYLVWASQAGHGMLNGRARDLKGQLEQACYQSQWNTVLAEFIYALVVELLGHEAACLGSTLGGMLLQQSSRQELLMMAEWPSQLLTFMVRKLEEMQARVSKVIMEVYSETGCMTTDDSKNQLMCFFQFYTVETTTGTLDVHESSRDQNFVDSFFRVNLVDSFGALMKVLRHLEFICESNGLNGNEVVLAVDFEGMKLCRNGPLCLVQMTCSDDPTLVYVLDIHMLGRRAFMMATPNGTSIKNLLENPVIRKIWFDPRNDVDALYHQFGIMPHGIFDLQLAEVADRRNRGLNVHYVQGLYKCLTQCPELQQEQKVFAERINTLGKNLYEPQCGGDYEIFRTRPLNPVILVYSAHDSRYMLSLYKHYMTSLQHEWTERILVASVSRARWCLQRQYVEPSSEAPEF